MVVVETALFFWKEINNQNLTNIQFERLQNILIRLVGVHTIIDITNTVYEFENEYMKSGIDIKLFQKRYNSFKRKNEMLGRILRLGNVVLRGEK